MRVRTLLADCDIRTANVVDAADVVYLTQRAYAEPYRAGTPVLFVDEDEESLARDMDAGWRMLVAHYGGLAVGAVRFRGDGEGVRVARLVVHPLHRRRGIAAALLRSVEQEAASRGLHQLATEVPADRGLVEFLEHRGFAQRSERTVGPLRFVSLAKALA
ncbi:MAG TPA: GNAT family N-acetyltransferase [Polyangia bacterium]|nr:GNAT family N-acetyltransferase [Polyangia bacterium]